MRYLGLIGLLLVLTHAPQLSAAPSCTPTKFVKTQNYPGATFIPHGNNLLQAAGKAVAASGQRLILKGTLRDRRCIPIAQAQVELWQNNPYGKWELAGRSHLATEKAVFVGAGRAYTNADGEFFFITAFPAPLNEKRAPFLNVKIVADGFKDASTTLFFANDERNEKDAIYKKLPAATRDSISVQLEHSDETDALTGSIDLVLPGDAPFKTY